MLCASAYLSARTVTFGDGGASTGWLDTGLLHKKSGAQVAVIRDGLATPSGELVFELTVENPQKLSVGNTTLRVLGGNQGGRIDCRDFSDTSDDEWVRFRLGVSGAGAKDLTVLELGRITLTEATDDLVEFSDGAAGVIQLQDPGNGALRYGSGQALDGLQALSLSNVGGVGDNSWALQVTARAFGVDSLSSFRIGKVEFSYSVAIPEPLQLDRTGCVLHLDAGAIANMADGSPLTAGWTDVSNLSVVATGVTPPVYLADGGGGYPAVRFDGVDDYLHANISTGNQVSVFVVFAHQRMAAPNNYRDILLTGANGGNNLSLASSRASASAPDYPSFNGLEHAALDFQTWVNGHHTGEVTGDLFRGRYYIGSAIYTNVPAEDALTIGARGASGVNAGQNDIRELIVYDRALTENERFTVESYLASKYKIAAVTRALEHAVESYPHVLGSQQFGDQYSFGQAGNYTMDYALQTIRQGNRVVKFRLSDKYANIDGFTPVAGVNALVELVRDQPEVKAIFDLPLTDYLFWVSTFSVPSWQLQAQPVGVIDEANWTAFYGENRSLYAADTYDDPAKAPSPFQGLDPASAQQIYDEVYDLVVYLLETYSGTGKRFYIGNWEGDWMLSGAGDYVDQEILPERLQAMIDWASTRQQAIDDAKAATAHSDVDVWFYLEANKMDWAREGSICVTNSVIPALAKLDFLSFSSYSMHKQAGFTADEAQMHADLDRLQSCMNAKPDASIPGSRLIIGEYGFQFGNTGRFADFEAYAREHVASLRNFLSWPSGTLRFILQWQFYSRQVTDEMVPYEMCQISEQHDVRPLYYLHDNFYREMRVWMTDYYDAHASLPSERAYADRAVMVLDAISLEEHVPDLSKPWPSTLELSLGGNIQIPDTFSGLSQQPVQVALYSRYGRLMSLPAMDWGIEPLGRGLAIDGDGVVAVGGNASPIHYTIGASLHDYPEVNTGLTVEALLPVASIYDTLKDFSKLVENNTALSTLSTNAATRFDGDMDRACRIASTSPEAMIWKVPELDRFYAKVYYYGEFAANFAASVSVDGNSWETIDLRVDASVDTADGWRYSWVTTAEPIPAGRHFLRVLLQHPSEVWTPQVGEVVLFGADTGFEFWKAQQFPGLTDSEVSAPSADPLKSGVPNLYRYFADLPVVTGRGDGLPKLEHDAGQIYYTLPLDPLKLDVRAQVKGSLDLQNWDYTLFDSSSDTAVLEQGRLWLNLDQMPAGASKFLRLELSLD
jgi:hypothetical protein